MTLRLSEEQTKALRRRAEKEGRSVQQVVDAAVEEYLARRDADEEVHRLGVAAVDRWQGVLDRLGD
ncbi:hypothetical protein Sme01_09150 [Sphaerisporangium melleum]|uniref:CopG family transcriptional regulator n=1 Tax=Sphaerisporangium melleum TaxID=321316 RepID=A0A917VDR2_9ACTN|nr:ribbon-helix-helix protein, CopG family [Sphaerisporangium melleum]GGK67757.1 hypothetical protein GCM10007964_08460 [Sphaerisporangium melleum]GII68439.1 hypothetical protein Sme01_09150 [Sphaerisporangium melleum]